MAGRFPRRHESGDGSEVVIDAARLAQSLVDRAVPCSMLEVKSAEPSELASPDGAADPPLTSVLRVLLVTRAPALVPATLAALPPTRANPNRACSEPLVTCHSSLVTRHFRSYSAFVVRGSQWAERVAAATDPFNLMRVMPPKEARAWPCVLPRMAFLF
jgi:hypothetical protein